VKWKVPYILVYSVMVIYSSFISFPLWSLLVSLIPIMQRRGIVGGEVLAVFLSFFILSRTEHLYIYPYVVRAFTFLNLFFASSEHLDIISLLDIGGEKALPLVVTMVYFPLFYQIAAQVFFYRRARRKPFSPLKLSRPILVEVVKVAENLYRAYTVKLYGNLKKDAKLTPSRDDLVPLALGVVALCLSYLLPISVAGLS
jgi:hypothetical protein